jgi:excinuclease ABC subunit A
VPGSRDRRPSRRATHNRLECGGALLHNLQHVDAARDVPARRLVVRHRRLRLGQVDTLARDVLHDNLPRKRKAAGSSETGRGAPRIEAGKHVDRVLEVDQTPIGKTPRSCPATYVGFWDAIRKLFADTAEARMRGWSPARFSFNTGGGPLRACEGQGVQRSR